MALDSYDPAGCGGNSDFLLIMDCDSEFESRLATVLCAAWEDVTELALDGTILHFEASWINPQFARGSLFAAAARAIIDEVFSEHAVLIMLSFPLEYEAEAPTVRLKKRRAGGVSVQ